ncbi:hypothetical protein ORI20_27705 [Mycobacterium sp. CVI_P3]|uniref:PPE family protein n=1 Tax=Mycobacterium pinniadriaticum TaxID=2994102 RepID=A0ABT3SLN7_9MYCO|nr:hypothetical protein [Mycobacterium pinniadriaticum]MCX2934058.1 hypothetical protein [Mycobacterium pinniadriaticum]MCX2940445.1 hypothetical protein [Mycobacterium pinniadriaticum]
MGQHTATTKKLTSVVAVGAIATAGLGSAPTANATCASLFGFGNSADCTSGPLSVAVAIGAGAQAKAFGWFSTALSVGTSSYATTGTDSAFTFATAVGDEASAFAQGIVGIATQLGPNGIVETSGSPNFGHLGINLALNVSPGTTTAFGNSVAAGGIGNIAVNLFGDATGGMLNSVVAVGTLNSAINLGGANNSVRAISGELNQAFNVFGSGNDVNAGGGPLSLAGTIGGTGQTVTKQNPGININGIRVPNTAAAIDPGQTVTAAALRAPNSTAHSARKNSAAGTGEPAAPASTVAASTVHSASASGSGDTAKKAASHAAAGRGTGSSKRQ